MSVPAIALPDPPLAADEVRLRPWRADDAAAVTAACQDPEIPRWTVVPSPYTERDARDWLAGRDIDRETGRELSLAVTGDGDRVVGSIALSGFEWNDAKAEIGYWVAREARGRRVGVRAARLLSRWGLGGLGLERIELLANPENVASQRLAQSAGFTREGLLRRYRRRHGDLEDLVMFSLLAEDLG